jgi:hypothetical protein
MSIFSEGLQIADAKSARATTQDLEFPEDYRAHTQQGSSTRVGNNGETVSNARPIWPVFTACAWKVHHALIKAKLEPYLGFLHSKAEGKLSLIRDFQELYRYLNDDFVIQYCRKLKKSVNQRGFFPKVYS